MGDDATTWVTLKVPEADREQAEEYKPDGATWGDCVVAGADRLNDTQGTDMSHRVGGEPIDLAPAMEEYLNDTFDVPQGDSIDELLAEIRKAQELAEQARDAAQRVEEGMGR